jgi:hypothetical protein
VAESASWVPAAKTTNSSGFSTGRFLSIKTSIKLKIAVLAPMPRAKVSIATEVNAGLL